MLGKILRELQNHSKWDIWHVVEAKFRCNKLTTEKKDEQVTPNLCKISLHHVPFPALNLQCRNVVRFQHRTQQSDPKSMLGQNFATSNSKLAIYPPE